MVEKKNIRKQNWADWKISSGTDFTNFFSAQFKFDGILILLGAFTCHDSIADASRAKFHSDHFPPTLMRAE